LAAFLLHVVIIAALLYLFRKPRVQEAFEPTGISVVYDAGASKPVAPRLSPIPTPSHAPPPMAAPPPSPEAQAQTQPEVNLDLPPMSLAPLPEPVPQPNLQPEQQPAAQSAQQSRPTHNPIRRTPPHHYMVMNNLSVGNPAPPTPFENKSLNLNIGGADETLANTPQITIQGHIGTDWQAGFNKWVNEHIYYPQAAAEQGQQGAATIEFTVHRDGRVTGIHLVQSAGSVFLDQAWMDIFADNNVPPFPPGTANDTIKITATLNYELIR
jgi:protein TonB